MALGTSDGPPLCELCYVTPCMTLTRAAMRSEWSYAEGMKWAWKGKRAYWRLCQPCHNLQWPLDHRVGNRCSMPATKHWEKAWKKRVQNGKSVLLMDDFYLTQTLPATHSSVPTPPPAKRAHSAVNAGFLRSFPSNASAASASTVPLRDDECRYSLGLEAAPSEEPVAPTCFAATALRQKWARKHREFCCPSE